MEYKTSKYNYYLEENNELLIINFNRGISSMCVVTDNEKEVVMKYLKGDLHEFKKIGKEEEMLIENGFLIPIDHDEESELELKRLDYIYDNLLHLVIHVTKNCNFRCKYCFIDFENKKLDYLVQEQIVKYINNNISKYSGVYISWFGGEPLMGMDVITNISDKVINICKRARKPYVSGITTNGYLLTKENIKKLIALKVYNYTITLDGLKDSHDKQRVLANEKGTYDIILNNLRYIRDEIKFKYLRIGIRTNFTKKSLEEIDEYLIMLDNEFSKDKRFSIFLKLAYDWGGERVGQIKDSLLDSNDMKKIYIRLLMNSLKMKVDNIGYLNFGGLTCNTTKKNKYVIGIDGLIAKCETVCEETKVGKIDSDGWYIDKSKESKWIFSYKLNNEKCHDCLFKNMCFNGSCPKKNLENNHTSSCPKPIFINEILLLYRKSLIEEVEKNE